MLEKVLIKLKNKKAHKSAEIHFCELKSIFYSLEKSENEFIINYAQNPFFIQSQ